MKMNKLLKGLLGASVAMAMFGAVYYIVPTLFPDEKLCPKMVRIHFFLAAGGIIFTFLPLAIGIVLESLYA